MDAAVAAAKDDLRQVYLEQRRTLTAAELAAARTAVRATVLERVARAGWQTVAAYVPLRTEPGSIELLEALIGAGVTVLVPHVLPDRDLDWYRWHPALTEDDERLGVDAISAAAVVFVPALAVADDGTRLGRGGGSYDRALARVQHGVPVVALLHDGERPHHLPADDWDRPVGAVATPRGWAEVGPE